MSKGFIAGSFGDSGRKFAIKMGKTKIDLSKGAEVRIQVDNKNKSVNKWPIKNLG